MALLLHHERFTTFFIFYFVLFLVSRLLVGDLKKHTGDRPTSWKLSEHVGLYSVSEVQRSNLDLQKKIQFPDGAAAAKSGEWSL